MLAFVPEKVSGLDRAGLVRQKKYTPRCTTEFPDEHSGRVTGQRGGVFEGDPCPRSSLLMPLMARASSTNPSVCLALQRSP